MGTRETLLLGKIKCPLGTLISKKVESRIGSQSVERVIQNQYAIQSIKKQIKKGK